MTDRVLVTGISGFIGSHVALKLLEKGYVVRGTVRNAEKGQAVIDRILETYDGETEIELVEANLAEDTGWSEAVKDCRYIQHIASPFPSTTPDHREALVPEARAGAQRVLEHGFSAGAERIVMTSSVASMLGRPGKGKHVTLKETDWSDPEWRKLKAYPVSKTRAELSAWAYAEAQGFTDRLTVVNPGFVLGPDTFHNAGTSLGMIRAMLKGGFPRVPKIAYPIIDVRDCAAIHVAGMTAKDAAGRRLIAGSNTLWFSEMADILRKAYPKAENLSKGVVPSWLLKFSSLFDDRSKTILADLGIFHDVDAAYVSSITQVVPRPAEEAVLAAAQSLIDQGVSL